VPRGARTEDVEELNVAMPMALYRAQVEALKHGFQAIYVASDENAPWDPVWGVLSG
jgi:hypothetical protein